MRRFVAAFLILSSFGLGQQPQSPLPSHGNITATYGAAYVGLSPAASATDIAVLSGNATNTVIVTWAFLQCTQTTAGTFDVQFLIRTTADSGGSSSTVTGYTFDQNNSNVTAVSAVKVYTANPTVNDGTNRLINAQRITAIASTTATPNDFALWKPSLGQSVVLRGTAQQLAINLNAQTVTGLSCDVAFQWIENSGY